MESYKFIYDGKEYELGINPNDELINDEEKPVKGIEISDVLRLLHQGEEIHFDITHYDQPCPNCLAGKAEKEKYFKFLEYHFYIYTKNGEYVTSSISKDMEGASFHKLFKKGKVDNSYIVSVIVCVHCGEYSIEIEQCDV
ncbi:hypothetical protein HNQ80_000520 [Anaerosolibacter carboniphilus]|uniref:DUF3785 domain-containing protein n=1 Tax=Anaerosolibacter carboniphilus TaxID=1417629 RepID=A0A841KQS1_9FIRM|nr:DUF3785 family protein [Anaerosolibacter carboniphilus]MBB6214440.1 hypothetical protein [Anaerosolibacter carboniphilus]